MSVRPGILAELAAAITAAAPRRLIARLDAEPKLAESWTWQEAPEGLWQVETSGGEKVTLESCEGRIGAAEQVRCSCLLSPRCLHVLATISLLRIEASATVAQEEQGGESIAVGSVRGDSPAAERELSEEQVQAARLAWQAGAEVLEVGAASLGAVLQADLLRAAHACRALGLHRLGRATLRVVQAVRDLRANHPAFTLDALASDLEELLATAQQLSGGKADLATLGRARRTYQPAGSLRLYGLCCEPVIVPYFAGVRSYVFDAAGRVFTLPEILPAEAARAQSAYDATVRLGETGLSHRQLCREGLFVHGATASAEGRLGAGEAVKAVRAGTSTWREVAAPWQADLASQLERALTLEDNEGASLLFLQVRVVGAEANALVVATAAGEGQEVLFRLVTPSDHEELLYRENLQWLARAPGLRFDLIARLLPQRPRTAVPLAIAKPADGEADAAAEAEAAGETAAAAPSLLFPSSWAGRCNLGLDRLTPSYLSGADSAPRRVQLEDPPDPLAMMRRRLERLALGGRATLAPSTLPGIESECRQLEKGLMPRAAAELRQLASEANHATRTTSGARRAGDPSRLAEAWLAARVYLHAATRVLRRALWK